jgi:uncharacterized membrane protein
LLCVALLPGVRLRHASCAVCCLLQLFITTTGVFMSSWLGGTLLSIGEFIIKRLPLVKHIYSASKQVRRCLMEL